MRRCFMAQSQSRSKSEPTPEAKLDAIIDALLNKILVNLSANIVLPNQITALLSKITQDLENARSEPNAANKQRIITNTNIELEQVKTLISATQESLQKDLTELSMKTSIGDQIIANIKRQTELIDRQHALAEINTHISSAIGMTQHVELPQSSSAEFKSEKPYEELLNAIKEKFDSQETSWLANSKSNFFKKLPREIEAIQKLLAEPFSNDVENIVTLIKLNDLLTKITKSHKKNADSFNEFCSHTQNVIGGVLAKQYSPVDAIAKLAESRHQSNLQK